MNSSPAPETYDSRTIAFHWASALLVLMLWSLGQALDWFPKDDPRMYARSVHVSVGVVLGLLLMARVVWRASNGVRLPAAEAGIKGRVAIGVHHLLYVLMFATVLAGIALVWARGDTLFNWITVPAFDPDNRALRRNVREFHEFASNFLLIAAGLHAAAAVWHHRVLRDGVLRRMWPRSPQT